MKTSFHLLWVMLIAAAPSNSIAQGNAGYEITCHIKSLKEGSKVKMTLESEEMGGIFTPMDSGYSRNGIVRISGVVPEGPRWYQMKFENGRYIALFISNGETISVKCDTDIYDFEKNDRLDWTSVVDVDGSPSNNAWHNIISGYYVYWLTKDRINEYLQTLKNSVGFDTSLVHAVLVCRNQLTLMMYDMLLNKDHFAPTTPSLKIAYLAYANQIYNSDIPHDSIFVAIYNALDKNERNSYYGKLLKKKIGVCVGQQFPPFTLATTEGYPVRLVDITSKSKLTIVNFWSSDPTTMALRKKYQSELRAMYKLYHEKGLNIIGVSADDSSTEYTYKKILREEGFPWPNVSDLQGRNGVVGKVYKEYGPEEEPGPRNITNYLIDSDGKIVAYDLTGLELQYFIWKYTKENAPTVGYKNAGAEEVSKN